MKKHSAIKADLFAEHHHKQTLDKLGDPLTEIESYIDCGALAAKVDRIAPRPVSLQGGRPPYPTETMVRILILKRLYNLSDKEQLKENAMPAEWKPAKRRQKDLDATWTKKHGKSHHGYKLSVNVDKRHKFIRKIVTDTASTHDSQHFAALMDPANTNRDVFADRGYPSEEREAWLKENGYRNRIQRKGHRNKPLSEAQQRRNHGIAKTRARVEHAFAAIEQMGGKLIRTLGEARANFAMTMMAACDNLKRLGYFQRMGIMPA